MPQIDGCNYMKFKIFCLVKGTINKANRSLEENIC